MWQVKREWRSKYQGSVHKPVDKYWTVGQACVARWDLDGKWYRGQVLVVGYQEFTVEFVDYGTVEIVTVEDMRKDLFMTEMPIQCFPVQLENIQPMGEKWERTEQRQRQVDGEVGQSRIGYCKPIGGKWVCQK